MQKPKVLIIGGGVAGLEAMLALSELASGLANVTLVAPGSEFLYKPLLVEELLRGKPVPRFKLAPLVEASRATHLEGSLESVDPEAKEVTLTGGRVLAYEALVVCVGARPRPAYRGVETFWAGFDTLAVDDLIDRTLRSRGHLLNLVVPPGTNWSLPLYELALLLRARHHASGRGRLRIRLITPEQGPLLIFGAEASAAVGGLLAARDIDVDLGKRVVDDRGLPADMPLGDPLPTSGPVVSLPILEGPGIAGLPADPKGFILIGAGCEVEGCPGVYAAGDGTTFPLKQGGLATQQADAAAERIAAELGSEIEPKPFRPVLRGHLLTGTEPLALGPDPVGADDATPQPLWWPSEKISGRYLTGALRERGALPGPPPASRPIEVEVSLPHEWHQEPMLAYRGPSPT